MSKQKIAARLLALALAGLMLVGCGAGSWQKTEELANQALRRDETDRAVQAMEDYLAKHETEAQAYLNVADFYELTMNDPETAAQVLAKGCDAMDSEDDAAYTLLSRYCDMICKSGALDGMAAFLPAGDEIQVQGRPFSQWTGQELWNLGSPDPENDYVDGSPAEDSWYYTRYYSDMNLTGSYDKYEDYWTLRISWSDLGSYTPYYGEAEGPAPEMPCGIQVGDSYDTVMEKLGVPAEVREFLADRGDAYFTIRQNELPSLWCSPENYGWRGVSVDMQTREYTGSLRFGTDENDRMNSYEITIYHYE